MQFARAQSASIPGKRMMFLDADHSGLNKFSGMEDENFNLLLQEIQRMATDGPSAIAGRHRKKRKANQELTASVMKGIN